MQQVPLFEAKNNLSFFVHLAEEGERIEITRHGKSVAALVNTQLQDINPTDEKNPFYLAYQNLQKKLSTDDFTESDWDQAFNIKRSKSSVRNSEEFE